MSSTLVRLAAVSAAMILLSGCAGLNELFDELDRAAELQTEWEAQQPPVQQTDYVMACHEMGGAAWGRARELQPWVLRAPRSIRSRKSGSGAVPTLPPTATAPIREEPPAHNSGRRVRA